MANRRLWIILLLMATVATLGMVVVRPAAAATPVRVMPLGDSITGSPGCWRSILWNRLQNTGFTDVDFVGTLGPQGCGQPYDGDNEGHGGILATNMASQNQLPAWLSATNPNVVLMHLGTNDVWSNRPVQTILDAFTTLVNQMRVNNPSMKIVVAKIIPMGAPSCADCAPRVVAFNDAIPAWASARSTAQSPIVVVDQWTGFSSATDTYDGVHPNATGDQKMSDKWYPALTPFLTGGNSTPPTSSRPPSSSSRPPSSSSRPPSSSSRPPSSSAGTGRSCSATFRVVGTPWPGGFQGEVTVRNTGGVATAGWTTRLTFPNGQQITQYWNATWRVEGTANVFGNVDHNRVIPVNGSAAYGFLASWNGTNGAPTTTCTAT
jgi:lysophospholipase L1-like esterase